MKSIKLSLLIICISTCFINCSSSNSSKSETPVNEMPAELKDSAALQADEENALEKLNTLIDTSNKEK